MSLTETMTAHLYRDYEYVEGAGTLDECNGRMTVTPDFPDGTYDYFLTPDFPIVPRCFKGKLSHDFAKVRISRIIAVGQGRIYLDFV